MKLFSEKVKYTSTNSSLNILCVEAFEEIFFGVYEIEINKNKYPVEKISEHDRNPVVSIPVTVEGVKRDYPFVLSQGKFEVLFNQNNTLNEEYEIVDETITDVFFTEIAEEVEEPITIPEIVDNRREILEQIQKAKKDAHRALQLEKSKNLKEIQAETSKKNKLLKHTLEEARGNLVEEFVSISKKIREELIDENDNRFNEIRQTIDNKIEDLANTLSESLKTDFKQSSKIFDKSIKELVKESYNSLQPKIDKELKSIAIDIVEKVSSIEKGLDEKLKDKADVSLIENVEGELNAVAKANIELNDKINKGVNKALSRVGNVDTKVSILTIALSEEVESKISKAEENITNYYSEKLKMLEEKTFDITEETRKYIVNLVTESRNNLISEIRKIKNEKPIEYIVESKGKKQSINSDDLVKDFDKKINSKIDTEVTRLRKYIAVYSGGGAVAVQFANGGTMNGNLTVVGSISASEYLGINVGGSDTLDTVTTRGNVTDNSITVGGLTVTGDISADRIYTTQLDAISANITVIDIKQYELSGFNVQGDCTVHGSVSANRFVTHNGLSSQFVKGDGSLDSNIYLTAESLNSNVILYPTTAASDLSGVFKLVTSLTDPYYNLSAVNVSTGSITTNEKLVGTLASEAGIIVGNPGVINVTVLGNIRKTAGGSNAAATFHFHIYKRSSSGTLTLIGISDNTLPSTNDTYAQFSTSLIANFGDWVDTDRLVVEFYAQRVEGGSNPTYDFEYGGETPVRILLPLPTDVLLSDYVLYTGATKDIDLGVHTITANNLIYSNGNTNSANLTIGTNDDYNLSLETAGSNRLTILSGGNVGIGTTTPNEKLTVIGNVSATGNLTVNQQLNCAGDASGANNLFFRRNSNNNWTFGSNGVGALMNVIGNSIDISQDVICSRAGITIRNIGEATGASLIGEAPDVLAQRRRSGSAAQEFRLYNTYTSASAAERATFKFVNNDFVIGAETLPLSGPQRSMLFQTNSATRMSILSSGQINLHGNATNQAVGLTVNTSSGNADRLNILFGATNLLTLDGRGSNNASVRIDGGSRALSNITELRFNDNNSLGTSNVTLYNPSSHVLEQRSALNSQTFNLYNTYTSATSAERATFKFVNNDFVIGAETLSGPQRSMLFQTNSATRMSILSSGNVGIGTITPSGALEIYTSSGTTGLRVNGGGNGSYLWIMGGNQPNTTICKTGIYTSAGGFGRGSMHFLVDTSSDGNNANFTDDTKMIIDFTTGNVGIGTTTPTAGLDILNTTNAGSGSLSGSVLNVSQTWNTTGTPTAFKLNVTDTASNASSLLMDLQTGGVSRFRVDKSGNIATPATFVDIATGRSWRFTGGNLTPLSNNVLNLGGTSLRIANGYFTNVDATGDSAYGASATFTYNTAAVTTHRNSLGLGVAQTPTFGGLSSTGDIEITDSTKGIILRSPNGTRWRVTVNNAGLLTPASI